MVRQTDKIDELHGQWLASQGQDSFCSLKTFLETLSAHDADFQNFSCTTSGPRVHVDTIRIPSRLARHATTTRKKVCHALAGTNSSLNAFSSGVVKETSWLYSLMLNEQSGVNVECVLCYARMS